jgi:hypothetical protein
VVCDDTDDMINHVIYHYFLAADRGEDCVMPPELTEEEQFVVAVLISLEEERRAFQGSRMPWPSRWHRPHRLQSEEKGTALQSEVAVGRVCNSTLTYYITFFSIVAMATACLEHLASLGFYLQRS